MVTDPGNRVIESYVETDNSAEARKAVSDGILNIHKVTSNRFWQFAALFGIMFVLGLIGFVMRLSSGFDDKAAWGYYVALFAFLMTTSSAAPMVAIAPRIAILIGEDPYLGQLKFGLLRVA